MAKKEKNRPSVFNWLLTQILLFIPGVNLISMILFAIFGKTAAKRKFAIAAIILMVLSALLMFAAFIFLPDLMRAIINELRAPAEMIG